MTQQDSDEKKSAELRAKDGVSATELRIQDDPPKWTELKTEPTVTQQDSDEKTSAELRAKDGVSATELRIEDDPPKMESGIGTVSTEVPGQASGSNSESVTLGQAYKLNDDMLNQEANESTVMNFQRGDVMTTTGAERSVMEDDDQIISGRAVLRSATAHKTNQNNGNQWESNKHLYDLWQSFSDYNSTNDCQVEVLEHNARLVRVISV